jgi:SPP1 gp7 family putative phage head morphogenesis protein
MNIHAMFDAAPRKAKRRVVLRPVGVTVAFSSALSVLSAFAITELRRQSRDDLYSAALAMRRLTADADIPYDRNRPNSLFGQALARMRDAAERIIERLMARFGRLFEDEGGRFDKRFSVQISAAVADGIDLANVLKRSSLEHRVTAATERHTALIRGLTAEIEKRIASKVNDLMVQGATNELIADALADAFGFGTRRARFIARDQAGKWNGELNRLRQTDVGVKEYQWSTSLDERVRGNPSGKYPNARPSHWDREGKTFRWDAPPSDGHPGYPINCRCTAKAVLEF